MDWFFIIVKLVMYSDFLNVLLEKFGYGDAGENLVFIIRI